MFILSWKITSTFSLILFYINIIFLYSKYENKYNIKLNLIYIKIYLLNKLMSNSG